MASAQVLSNSAASSRKKKNLEAGRRMLEEFRKKKAATKKAVSTSQPCTGDATLDENQTSENGQASLVNSVSAVTDGTSEAVTRASGSFDHIDKSHMSAHYNGSGPVSHENISTQSDSFYSPDLLQKLPTQVVNSPEISNLSHQTSSAYLRQTDDIVSNFGTDTGVQRYGDAISSSRPSVSQDLSSSDSHINLYGFDKDNSSISFQKMNMSTNDGSAKFHIEEHVANKVHRNFESGHSSIESQASASEHGYSHSELKNHFRTVLEERKPSNAVGTSVGFGNQQAPETHLMGFNSNDSSLFNGPSYSAVAELNPRRSRPPFLDSLDIVKNSSVSGRHFVEKDKFVNSLFPSSNIASSSAIPSSDISTAEPLPTPASSIPSNDFFGNASKGHKLFQQSLDSKLEFTSQKQNEDFAALEQHIEDLTQEKFSLQRTLEASRTLAESLAAENSSLTESYNQQESIVNQLKAEMERLQDEIKGRLVELEAIKGEYMNAQLECNAADERAKILASEVISLEEKALRLRSNELKLERDLENSSAEIASYKKKLSSLDKDRRDLQQTIDALQEEKKLLQSKLRRASASGISIDLSKGDMKKDASTSTNDLGLDSVGDSSEQVSSNIQMLDNIDNLLSSFSGHEDSAMSIPFDQMQMIQNINALITEIALEKKELMQALIAEVSTSTKLKELNKELSQKLEVQTQRLELLTAQSMASENIVTRQPTDSHTVRESVSYADEGDEVVERVLGWIMKLFPGGPSKRRTSRL